MKPNPGHLAVGMIFRLAWRNLWRNRRRTLVTLSSIALGFGMAVFSIGLGDGSHNSMIRHAIHQGEGHITIQPVGYLESPANHKYLENGVELSKAAGSSQYSRAGTTTYFFAGIGEHGQ